jgi:hypothetical protein
MFLWVLNPTAVSLKIPSDAAVWMPMMVRIDVQILKIQFIRAMGRQFDGLCGSFLFGLYMSLVALVRNFGGYSYV